MKKQAVKPAFSFVQHQLLTEYFGDHWHELGFPAQSFFAVAYAVTKAGAYGGFGDFTGPFTMVQDISAGRNDFTRRFGIGSIARGHAEYHFTILVCQNLGHG